MVEPKRHPVIRAAQPGDAAALARLNALFNDVHEPVEHYTSRLSSPGRVDTPILAELEGQVVGVANLRLVSPVFYTEPYAELTELFVVEAYRRRGIARLLVTFTEDLARQGGAREMIILTDFYNHEAQSLYWALGYRHHDLAVSKEL